MVFVHKNVKRMVNIILQIQMKEFFSVDNSGEEIKTNKTTKSKVYLQTQKEKLCSNPINVKIETT